MSIQEEYPNLAPVPHSIVAKAWDNWLHYNNHEQLPGVPVAEMTDLKERFRALVGLSKFTHGGDTFNAAKDCWMIPPNSAKRITMMATENYHAIIKAWGVINETKQKVRSSQSSG